MMISSGSGVTLSLTVFARTPMTRQVAKHASVAEINADQQKAIPLEACLNLFTQQEKLSATDTWFFLPTWLTASKERAPCSQSLSTDLQTGIAVSARSTGKP